MSLLNVKHLQKIYSTRFSSQKVEALKDVSFDVEEGEYIAIMGESGSGKTTLLNILASLDKPTSGEVLLDGKDLTKISDKHISAFRRDNLGFVFQDFNLLDTFNVADNIYLPLVLSKEPYALMKPKLEKLARPLGINHLLEKYPYEISGGQKQRVAIAGILAMSPSIIILDEATSMLDPRGRKEINELVKELKKQNNMTIISITHDIEEAKNADRVILLNKGEIVDCDKPQKILTNEKLLKELKLDIPFSLKIARKLQKKGYQIKDTLDVEELEKQLCQLHAKV